VVSDLVAYVTWTELATSVVSWMMMIHSLVGIEVLEAVAQVDLDQV
jgi:hypothetical protein